jgi:hypothetical protein
MAGPMQDTMPHRSVPKHAAADLPRSNQWVAAAQALRYIDAGVIQRRRCP